MLANKARQRTLCCTHEVARREPIPVAITKAHIPPRPLVGRGLCKIAGCSPANRGAQRGDGCPQKGSCRIGADITGHGYAYNKSDMILARADKGSWKMKTSLAMQAAKVKDADEGAWMMRVRG